MFLLDTNVLSELRKGARSDPAVRAWAIVHTEASLFVSVITLVELQRWVLLVRRRDPDQAARLSAWFDSQVLATFENRILSIDRAVALRCAALYVPDPAPDRDALIAATAIEHQLTVVTRNVRDFARMGVKLLNPWSFTIGRADDPDAPGSP